MLHIIMEQMLDWFYSQAVNFYGQILSMMDMMSAEIFELDWIKALLLFFKMLAWSLYTVGLVVSVFDTVVEMQGGRGSIRGAAINIIKGFMAVGLFTIVPIELYVFSITLQSGLITSISGLSSSGGGYSALAMTITMPAVGTFILLLFALLLNYAIIKVFFANLKRGGILIIMIAVGSLYMFSVPRGYTDGFMQWCKQVIGLCVTAFLQTIILVAGLLSFNVNMLLGTGLMLAATEVPRIAGHFGLETGTRANFMSVAYTAQSAVNLVRSVATAVK